MSDNCIDEGSLNGQFDLARLVPVRKLPSHRRQKFQSIELNSKKKKKGADRPLISFIALAGPPDNMRPCIHLALARACVPGYLAQDLPSCSFLYLITASGFQ